MYMQLSDRQKTDHAVQTEQVGHFQPVTGNIRYRPNNDVIFLRVRIVENKP